MKKKILGGIAVLAIAVVAAMNVNLNTTNADLSDTSLANVEVLAYGETTITACLSLWGTCTLPSGTTSSGPAVEASF
jgi:hypothetical protein